MRPAFAWRSWQPAQTLQAPSIRESADYASRNIPQMSEPSVRLRPLADRGLAKAFLTANY
jgi:hypothetical protein